MNALFVAGTGTEIGKTHVSELLIAALREKGRRVWALKPVASGVPAIDDPAFAHTDPARLLRALSTPLNAESLAACSPWRFVAALSPDMAARAEGRALALTEVLAFVRAAQGSRRGECILLEGVGGLMSPICEDALNLDLACALGWPIALVSGSYLGAISHTLTALEALQGRGGTLWGVLVNESDGSPVALAETAACLRRFAPGAPIASLRRGEQRLPPALAEQIETQFQIDA